LADGAMTEVNTYSQSINDPSLSFSFVIKSSNRNLRPSLLDTDGRFQKIKNPIAIEQGNEKEEHNRITVS
jgi:hypothetical protein